MKNNLLKSILVSTFVAFLFYGCDTMQSSDIKSEDNISEDNLLLASQIIGSSLSDQDGGLLSSLYDAKSKVGTRGISYPFFISQEMGNALSVSEGKKDSFAILEEDEEHPGNRHGRGRESNYQHNYNPDTGEHTISFFRNIQTPNFSQDLSVNSIYIFTDVDGGFVEFPGHARRGGTQIESISFRSTREGSAESKVRSNNFFRSDSLFFEGLSDESPIITLDGTHNANGEMRAEIERPGHPTERAYQISLKLDDIQLDKEVLKTTGAIDEAITGFISYAMTISTLINGEREEEELSGVIELTGDGNAWLQFYKVPDFFRIVLKDGGVTRNADRGDADNRGGGRDDRGDGDCENDGDCEKKGDCENDGDCEKNNRDERGDGEDREGEGNRGDRDERGDGEDRGGEGNRGDRDERGDGEDRGGEGNRGDRDERGDDDCENDGDCEEEGRKRDRD